VRVGGVQLPPGEGLSREVLGGGGDIFERGDFRGCLGRVGCGEEERSDERL